MARGCSFLHLPQNDATVTVEVEDNTHNKISYSAKLGSELGLTPCGYRVYHAEFKDSTEEEGEYKVAKDKSVCPYCQRVRNNASTKNIIYEKNESELSHCRTISGEYTGMRRYVPAKLQIELYKNKCGYCNKPYRDTLSDLREGNKHYTPALEKYIREVSVQSDLTELANKFSVSKKEVFAWYKEQVEYRDSKSRKVPQPKSLGLYTLTFNDTATDSAGKKINAGKKAAYCLCVDEENQTFIGFFPWHDAAKKKAFFDSIPNIAKVSTVFIYLDDVAAKECKRVFPSTTKIVVERCDVLNHVREATDQVLEDERKANPDIERLLLTLKNDLLYGSAESWKQNAEQMQDCYNACPALEKVQLLYSDILSMYDSTDIKDAEDEFDNWVAEIKDDLLPMKALQPQLEAYREEILEFIPLRGQLKGISKVRKEYEELLEFVPYAITNLNRNGKEGAYAARTAGWDYLYGHVMYGVMDRVNNRRIQEHQDKQNAAAESKFTHNFGMAEALVSTINKTINTVRHGTTPTPELITYSNFSIPLKEFYDALVMMHELMIPREIPEDTFVRDDPEEPPTSTKTEVTPMDGFDKILAQLRAASTSKSNQGTMMERLIKQFLLVSPLYSRVYDKVWLWTEFPYNSNQHDLGIDLVAHIRGEDDGYCAVQVKFYDETHAVQKADVDTFLSASGKPFYIGGVPVYFQQRLIVSTTDKWSGTAENTIIGQRPPVNRIRLKDLRDSGIDWDSFTLDSIESMKQAPKKQPRPHQREAIKSVLSGFAEYDRGKLIMACGTGKTLTGLKIAEGLTQGNGNVLVLVPSISLLNQTLSEWAAQCAYPYTVYGICSDPKASKITEDEIIDTMVPATTDVDTLIRQFADCDSNTLQLFFSTYQSINVVHDFQLKTGVAFDLVICDEAHRTTGVTLAGEDDSNFVRVHDNEYIRALKRLYMTATPRIYGDDSKKKAMDNSALLCSMDDESIYGPEFYRLSFSDAVSQGLLSDYKVIVLAVDEEFVNRSLQKQLTDANNELTLDDAVKIVGCMNGLAKKTHFPGEDDYFANDPQPMRRAVAFTQTIDQSKKFVAMFEEIQALYKINTSDGDGQTVELKHVDGKTNALERKNRIDWLKQDAGENTCRVLSNARCLSEGVDVPALDAVMFLSPRSSIVDIIQSVGRVMRKSEGKKYGYIILPIGIPAGVEPEAALTKNKKYEVVWNVLQALRAHDDRFNNTINRIELNKNKPDNISIIGVTGFDEDVNTNGINGSSDSYNGSQLAFDLTELNQWKNNIYAKIVKKCGSRQYWETWAKDIAEIAARHITEIKVLIEQPEIAPKFEAFLDGLRHNLNPSIGKEDAIEMLAEHLITKPVFDALFENYSFLQSNPVSQIMQNMLDVLHDNALEKEQETLDKFYASVQERAKGIDNAEGKQKIIIELYEQFFKNALPKQTERLGIVYTPVEVVDFIIQSVEYVMKQRFGHSISDMGVHVLDPFTGTGTFIVRLLRSGIIKPEDLLYKYTSEIHCNEIVLLAYYIAAVNIEETYHELSQSENYVPFEGIVLTDTFELAERVGTREGEADTSIFQPNADRATKQMQTPIQVIIGNPPYSVGQKTGNDNNQNLSYPNLDSAIAKTYVANSNSNNSRSVYDSYIKAFRWATDRITDNGIIAFVTNGAYIDSVALDGFRKSLVQEFNSVYCFNLRGNQRTSGELSRKEGGKIFGSGSRTPVAITILVRKKGVKKDGYVRYYDIGDYLSRADKLHIISDFGSVEKMKWQYITPAENGDWINRRNPNFITFPPIAAKRKDEAISYFSDNYAIGQCTNRDVWLYNFSENAENAEKMIEFYNKELSRCQDEWKKLLDEKKIGAGEKAKETLYGNIRSTDSTKISWSRGLLKNFCRDAYINADARKRTVMRRPFCKVHCYYKREIMEYPSKWESIFPNEKSENLVICVSGSGSSKGFSTLITDGIQDYQMLFNAQSFPLCFYDKEVVKGNGQLRLDGSIDEDRIEYHKRYAITEAIFTKFRTLYGDKVNKDDIFYYLYAVLNSPKYVETYSESLVKEMPRIPMLAHFPEYVRIGRALADLHLHYEKPVTVAEIGVTVDMRTEDYTIVDKMRFGKGKDKSIIEYNPYITIRDIPAAAYDYIVNGKSAIEWIVEQYAVTTDKASGIVNDPNTYAGGRYVFDLLLSIISVSLKTQELIAQLPEYKEI